MEKGKENVKEQNPVKKVIFAIRILISIILGFLPSFLFIALFIQYGSPLSNYINFLSNLNSSWIAWISAVIIALFINFIRNAAKKGTLKKIAKNKFLLVILILCFAGVIALISVQLYLYVNFILRNDILVRLSVDKSDIFFADNSNESVTVRISVTMNPFCSAECKYDFFDVSKGEEIDTGVFNLTSISSESKTYTLNNAKLVQGSQVLNQFKISCKSTKTLLCYTKGVESQRSVLITLNYNLSQEDKIFKETSKERIILAGKSVYFADKRLNESTINLASINNSFFIEDFLLNLKNLSGSFLELNQSFSRLETAWEMQNFTLLRDQLSYLENNSEKLSTASGNLSLNVILNISFYNNLINNLTDSRLMLESVSTKSLNTSLCEQLNGVILDFDKALNNFQSTSNLQAKKVITENIFYEINLLYDNSQSGEGAICQLTSNISQMNLKEIDVTYLGDSIPAVSIKEPVPICCVRGECEKCCDDSCSEKNYPIIFLHGHGINRYLPADYSFDSFTKLKQLIAKDHIDAGAMIISPISEEKGLWGKVDASTMVTASYFFDTYQSPGGEKTVVSNEESIDTYAVRLKSIVDLMKYRTNKDKVIIIAHSMGGLVTRRYIQLFGSKDVDKIILVTVPNHGIDDKVRDYCAILGQKTACYEMDKNSLFINQLNSAQTETVPIYNIIGIGCDMGDDTGDGIIKKSSQYLDYATNFYVDGTCDEINFQFLHETILYPELYPKVYTVINDVIKND